MPRKLMDRRYRVDRRKMYETLGFKSDKIPATVSGDYLNIPLYRDVFYFGVGCGYEEIGTFNLVVKPSPRKFSMKHRVFIKCGCGKEIPSGRFHQHVPSCPTHGLTIVE